MNIGEKIRAIREAENLTRKGMQDKTGINRRTIETLETNRSQPKSDKLQAICAAFPQYTLWLMIGTINPELKQRSPIVE